LRPSWSRSAPISEPARCPKSWLTVAGIAGAIDREHRPIGEQALYRCPRSSPRSARSRGRSHAGDASLQIASAALAHQFVGGNFRAAGCRSKGFFV
jgi:hypothetical protein